ncbi:hypothetical protein INS49_001445 [Diaporthe citri]|uniref:uncharacterized protein n=1 Tax=Diaporthe citri TaxID=83186 RepID=UPI001C80C1AF|nr:uncharacterized protein INS49_001445 [Diaporthe citri]KAG6367258.1 hypothetical protein INS49_001445 [Diaporthe citri]
MSTSRDMPGLGGTGVPDGSQEQPILVDEDHDVPQSGIGFEVERLVRQVQKGDARFNPIDLDGEDENLSEDPWRADEENYDRDNAKIELEELTDEPEDTQGGPCVHWKKGIRNPCPCGTHQKVPKVMAGSIEISQSQVVELKVSVRVGRYEAEFLEVYEIWVSYKGGDSFVRGLTYARTRNLEGRIVPRKNEVCEIYELDENDHRTYLEQALVEVPIQNIKTIRILHKTNRAFPECRFDPVRYRTKKEREDRAPIICRWKQVLSYPDSRYRRQQRPIAGEVIEHYSQDDIPKERHRIPDSERRKPHEKIRGGSFVPNGAPKADPEASLIHQALKQKYAAADFFCGAGGSSKGAEMAGLKVLVACDWWTHCCETYRQNFPDVELHQKDVYKFIEDMSTDLTREHLNIDILHFSPPCQTWSPAHTCEGKKDEENRAALFACEKMLVIFRPRIFTVEQTFGLAQDRWIPNFNALLQGFTRHGYSVKWKVLHLVEYGLPQTRKRLVMIGAAPGEQLPAWPRPTHSKDPKDGQKPFVSAFQACSALVEGENRHDVKGARPANKVPWDSSKPLGRTVTCSGGQCHHWSGERDFTLAEFAVIQGFPTDFRFEGKCIKKQIGNAFAPIVVKVLLKCIRVHLENFDGVTREPPPGQVIILSDDDNDSHDNNRSQLQHKDQSQSQIEGPLVVEDLVGFCRKPSGLSQELLQGMINDGHENPMQCFLAKGTRKSSKGNSSPGPNPRRSSRIGSRQAQPTQRNTLNSYFLPVNDQDSPSAANTVLGGNSSVAPQNAAGSTSVTADDDHTATQDATAGASRATFQIPSTSDESTTGQASSARQTAGAGRTINAGIIAAQPRQSPPDSDEPRTRRSAQSAVTIADLIPSARQTRSSTSRSTAGPSGGQTIVGSVLSAPAQDSSDSDSDRPMARRSARTAQTIADLNYSPRQTRSTSLRSTGHRSARTAQTLAGLDEESSAGRSTSSDAAARRPRRTGRIVRGVITAPRRQSPPGFDDTTPLYQAAQTTQTVTDSGDAPPSPAPRVAQHSRVFNNSAPLEDITQKEAVAGVTKAAMGTKIFPGLVKGLQNLKVDKDPAVPALPGPQGPPGLDVASPGQTPRTGQDTDDVLAEPTAPIAPRHQSPSDTRDGTPGQDIPTSHSGLFEGTVSSTARQTGIRAALANASQHTQAREDAGGPSRRRSSGDSVAYMGESSRAGARPSLPFVVEDDEEEAGYDDGDQEEDEDEEQQLQRAIKMSLGVVSPVQEVRRFAAQGFDPDETALAIQASILEAHRPSQDLEPEDLYTSMDHDAPAPEAEPEPEPEMYGPGDYKGKGRAVAPRKYDKYAEDEEEAEREGSPSKRPRGSK